MRCTSCQQDNPAGTTYCEWCGTPLGQSAEPPRVETASPAARPPAVSSPHEKRRTMYDPAQDAPAASPPERSVSSAPPSRLHDDFFAKPQTARRAPVDADDPFATTARSLPPPERAKGSKHRTVMEAGVERPQRRLAGALFVFDGPDDIGRVYELGLGRTTIGRDDDRNVVLDDDRVSGEHGFFFLKPDGTGTFIDTSSNGTKVDGRAVLGENASVQHGSRLVLGGGWRDPRRCRSSGHRPRTRRQLFRL